MNEIKMDDLVGKKLSFFGVDGNHFKLDGLIYEAVEDENDGYRSMLGSVRVVEKGSLVFFKKAVARVTVESADDDDGSSFEGWKLRDRSGHVWLTLGTNLSDDYYPSFIFRYEPKK